MSSSFIVCSDYACSERLRGLVLPKCDCYVLSGCMPKYISISRRPLEFMRFPDFFEPLLLGGDRDKELIFVGEYRARWWEELLLDSRFRRSKCILIWFESGILSIS